MDLESEIKTINSKDEFIEQLDSKRKGNYDFLINAYFLKKEKKNELIKNVRDDYSKNIITLLESEIDLINRYNDFFIDELRNYTKGTIYNSLKECIIGDDDLIRKKCVNYIKLMNEYDLTYEEELDFGGFIVNEYKNNRITLEEDLDSLMNYLERKYEEE